jgi:hypothetical protein
MWVAFSSSQRALGVVRLIAALAAGAAFGVSQATVGETDDG